MNAVSTMKNLKEFIKDNFESIDECAEVLDVSRRTVENYMYVNPCGILKHSAKFVQRKDINPLELFDAVGESMEQINEQRAKN